MVLSEPMTEDLSIELNHMPTAPAPRRAPQRARTPNNQKDEKNQLATVVDLDKLLKGPIEEIYRSNTPGDAEFLVNHMKASLQGLLPTIESFEHYNLKLEEENRRLAEEEADLDERLRSLGIVVVGGGQSGGNGNGGGGGGVVAAKGAAAVSIPSGASSLVSGTDLTPSVQRSPQRTGHEGERDGGPDGGEVSSGGGGGVLQELDQELLELENEIEYAQMELDDILEMVRRDVSIVKKIEERAPAEIKEFLNSSAFWDDVRDRYHRLDADGNGTVDADELFPIIVELTDSEPWAVTELHCQKFLRIFDIDGDGTISEAEFSELLRFCVLMTTVDGSSKEEEDEGVATVQMAKSQVDEVIKCVEQDVGMIAKFEAQCPAPVRDFLSSEEFWAEVNTRYAELDVDGNGVVDPEELFPVVIELTNSEPWAVTDAHCRKFAYIFDEDGDGKINVAEFEKLVRFCVIMSALDEVDLSEADAASQEETEGEEKD